MYQKLVTLFKSSSIYTIGNLINRALFLISMPIMTRYLVPEEYGTLSIINAVIGIMITCYGLGSTSFAMRYYYEYDSEKDRKRLMGAIFSYILFYTLIVSVLLSIFAESIFQKIFKDISFYPYMILGLWICFISMLSILPDILFRIRDQAILYISIQFAKSTLVITLAIVSVVFLHRGAEGPLAASLVVGIIFGFYYLYYLKDKISFNFSISIIKRCLKFSLPVLFLLLGRVLLDSTDRLILQHFVGLSVVGFYSVGSTIGSVLVMIASSINSAWAPFFYATSKEESEIKAKELFSYASVYMGTIILFLGLCAVIFSKEIIYILAPPSYYPVIKIIPYIMIGATLNALFFIPVRGIYQEKKTGFLPIIILIALIINIVLNFILIPKFQMLGAAVATVIASFVMLSICFIVSQKVYYIAYQYNRLFKVLAVCVLCYILSLFVNGYSLILSISLKTLIIALFPVILYMMRFFEPREIEKIKELMPAFLKRIRPAW